MLLRCLGNVVTEEGEDVYVVDVCCLLLYLLIFTGWAPIDVGRMLALSRILASLKL